MIVYVERSARPDVLVDLGCGSGYVVSERAGIEAGLKVGVDAWRWPSWESSAGTVFVVADVLRLPFRSEAADVVVTLDVLEHVPDDGGALEEAGRLLRPRGHAVVMVPAFSLLWSKHDDAVGHLRRYRTRDLTARLSSVGFRVVQTSYFYAWLFPVALARRVLRLGGRREATPRVLGPVAHVFGRLERFCIRHRIRIPFGSSLFVEAVPRPGASEVGSVLS